MQGPKQRWQGGKLKQLQKTWMEIYLVFCGDHSPLPRAEEKCGSRPVKRTVGSQVLNVAKSADTWKTLILYHETS